MLRLVEMLAKTEPMVKCNGTPFGIHFTASSGKTSTEVWNFL